MKRSFKLFLSFFILVHGFTTCIRDQKSSDILTVRIQEEPDNLNPLFSKTTQGQQALQNLYLSLGRFDPQDLKLIPVLMKGLPIKSTSDLDYLPECKKYTIELDSTARWSDGTPISNNDVAFTFKTIANPELTGINSQSVITNIKEIVVGSTNPKLISFYIDSTDLLASVSICDVPILPAHILDEKSGSQNFTFKEILSHQNVDSTSQLSLYFGRQRDFLKSAKVLKDYSITSGPYSFQQWEAGQFLRIKRKNNWWGTSDKFPNFPEEIIYKILKDDLASVEALKSGTIDVMADVPGTIFNSLKNDQLVKSKVSFFTPDVLQYFYIAMNNAHPILTDINTRNALARMVPIREIIKSAFLNQAKSIVGPILPIRQYYNQMLVPIDFDSIAAVQYLTKAGWKDSDNDGILDKVINGKKVPFVLEFLTTQKKLARDIALIFQQYTAKFKVKINITALDAPAMIKEVKLGNFACSAMAVSLYPGIEDLYGTWYSYTKNPGRTNFARINNPKLDVLIDKTRETSDRQILHQAFRDFQDEMYKQQHVIFLCAPEGKVMVNNKWDPLITNIRPGFIEAGFKRNK